MVSAGCSAWGRMQTIVLKLNKKFMCGSGKDRMFWHHPGKSEGAGRIQQGLQERQAKRWAEIPIWAVPSCDAEPAALSKTQPLSLLFSLKGTKVKPGELLLKGQAMGRSKVLCFTKVISPETRDPNCLLSLLTPHIPSPRRMDPNCC